MALGDVSDVSIGGAGVSEALTPQQLDGYRRELTGYCYRMLGSGSEAEDAVQETMLRAWRSASNFEGRSSVRSWLYRIATNVCLDMHRSVQRRARPMDLGPSSPPSEEHLGTLRSDVAWITPIPDAAVVDEAADPGEVVAARESIRLAFIRALQHLPARQRAVLILCDVLRWHADEAAMLLETTVAAVNSALQRARSGLATLPPAERSEAMAAERAELLASYVEAFEAYDIDRLVTLLHADAVMSMPPFAMWIEGASDIGTWMVQPGPSECAGSRLLTTEANGYPTVAQYRRDPDGNGHFAWGLQVLEMEGDRITGIQCFLDVADVFPQFGLPLRLGPGEDPPSAPRQPA